MPPQEELDKEHVQVGLQLVDHVHGDLGHEDMVPVDLVDGEPGDGGHLHAGDDGGGLHTEWLDQLQHVLDLLEDQDRSLELQGDFFDWSPPKFS